MASTSYLALVIDRTTEEQRPRCIGVIWAMLTIGIIVGAISISLAVSSIDGISDPLVLQSWLQKFMISITSIVMILTIFSTWGVEKPTAPGTVRPAQDLITLQDAWGVVTSSRQIVVFFGFLVLFTLGLFLQDPILESFGAEVFEMPVSKTTLLNAWWGSGTLVGLLIAGWFITPKLGKLATARLGCWMVMGSLFLLVISGWQQASGLLPLVMVLFGLAAGVGTNSALTLMLDLTLPAMAGTFVGIWGLAQALSRGLGKVVGGGLLDLGRQLLPGAGPMAGYGLVFSIEILIMAGALIVLNQLSVGQFRESTNQRLDMVLMAEIDG
jgi:BCD family chlorophyll transporter-like MFS transporter